MFYISGNCIIFIRSFNNNNNDNDRQYSNIVDETVFRN